MAAKKKTAGKKPASAKPAQKKPARKAPASSATRKASAGAGKAATKKKAAGGAKSSKASSTDVNLGHVFALRPRVSTSFRPDDFRAARQLLDQESYATIEAAARAVAEKALELTHEGPPSGKGFGRRR